MSTSQRRARDNKGYIYRPFTEDPVEVAEMRAKWLGAMVSYKDFDLGTKSDPKGTPEERQVIAADARVVLETLGLFDVDYEPPAWDPDTTRPEAERGDCGHMLCATCFRCHCHNTRVMNGECERCRWQREQKSGQAAIAAGQEQGGRA